MIVDVGKCGPYKRAMLRLWQVVSRDEGTRVAPRTEAP
jgi:hypothetical protein